jgi:hypothetical protein
MSGVSSMNVVEAKTILETLARGIDPATGEIFAEQSPFNNPQVIRALFLAAQDLENHGQGEPAGQAERERSKNAGRSWPPQEDEALLRDFDAGMSVKVSLQDTAVARAQSTPASCVWGVWRH